MSSGGWFKAEDIARASEHTILAIHDERMILSRKIIDARVFKGKFSWRKFRWVNLEYNEAKHRVKDTSAYINANLIHEGQRQIARNLLFTARKAMDMVPDGLMFVTVDDLMKVVDRLRKK